MEQLNGWFAELYALIGVEQNLRFHAEGDVYTHTMMVVDEAAKLRKRVSEPFGFMLGALVHDFGKAVCTENINGVIHAYHHETKGLPIAKAFLERITAEQKVISMALNLTELHMKPVMQARAGSSMKSMNKMFDAAIDAQALLCLALADDRGRFSQAASEDCEEKLSAALEVYRQTMAQPYVMGRDLIEAGLRAGPDFTELLAYAHKLRLAGVEKKHALKQTLAYARTLEKRKEC